MEINAKSIRVLCAVFDTGSLQAASARVSLSPSAISRIVSAAEQTLGMTLFDRRERRMVPTVEGRSFHARAREALLLLDDLAGFGKNSRSNQKPPLRVAALSRHAQTIVAPAITMALGRNPGIGPVSFDMHAQRDFGYSRLTRPFDIGFGNLVAAQEELDSMVIAQSKLVACLPPNHVLAGREHVTAQDIAAHPLITLSRDTIIGSLVMSAIGPDKQLEVVAEVSHTYLAVEFVTAGVGLHVTDMLAALDAPKAGCTLVPLEPEKSVALLAFWPRRKALSDRAEALLAAVREYLAATEERVCKASGASL